MPTRAKTLKPRTAHAAALPRESAASRGYDRAWRRARELFLAANPLCMECLRHGHTTASHIVDHVIPHRGDPALFWDAENWQALCKPCHDRKTGRGE